MEFSGDPTVKQIRQTRNADRDRGSHIHSLDKERDERCDQQDSDKRYRVRYRHQIFTYDFIFCFITHFFVPHFGYSLICQLSYFIDR